MTVLPDPTDAINAAFAAGHPWDGGGLGNTYIVPAGIFLTSPGTIQNATFYNPYIGLLTPTAVADAGGGVWTMTLQPADMARVISGQAVIGAGITGATQGATGQVTVFSIDQVHNMVSMIASAPAVITGLVAGTPYTFIYFARHPGEQFSNAKALVSVHDTNHVNMTNIATIGGNAASKGYHGRLVGQHGFEILSSDTITITNCTSTSCFGDNLILAENSPKNKNPCSNITVNGFVGSYAGRVGLTPGFCVDSVLSNITIHQSTEIPCDFESDNPAIGCANVRLVNLSVPDGSVRVIQQLSGPIYLDNLNSGNGLEVLDHAGLSGELVTVTGGEIALPRNPNNPPAGIFLDGGAQVNLDGVALSYQSGTTINPGPAWIVQEAIKDPMLPPATQGSKLTLADCTLNGRTPLQSDGASLDPASTVVITATGPPPPPPPPKPTITGLSPNTGPKQGGNTVTITGTNFDAEIGCVFAGNTAKVIQFINSTTILVLAPAGLVGLVSVNVTTQAGTSPFMAGITQYTYTNPITPPPPPPPVIYATQLIPPSYAINGTFSMAGGGINGALVDAWAQGRFDDQPAENDPVPDNNPADGRQVTTATNGGPGRYQIIVTGVTDYYVRTQWQGVSYWSVATQGELGPFTGV